MEYRLDKIDYRILFELERNSRVADTKIASLVRKSKESVRYRIKKMQEEGIIKGFTTWIDPVKLGYRTAKFYLTLSSKPERKKALINYVKADKRLFWLGSAEGAWNIGLTFFVKSNEEFFDLKNNLLSEFGDIVRECKTASVVSIHYHDKNLLYDNKSKWNDMLQESRLVQIDEAGKKVLKELFHNSRANVTTIAHNTKLTVEVVRHRMKTLEKQEIIKRYTTAIDYSKIGYDLYKTFIYWHNLSNHELERFMSVMLNHPSVIHIVRQISPWDLELEILTKSYSEYNKLLQDITEVFNNISKVETAILSQDEVFPAKEMIFE